MEQIKIYRLTPDRVNDFLDFFDKRAFRDYPQWNECYCCFYRIEDESVWEQATGDSNRSFAENEIISGRMHGYLAYHNGQVIGWCNGDALDSLPRLGKMIDSFNQPREKAFGISCFLVDIDFRQHGIAGDLLRFAVQDAKDQGFRMIYAIPRKRELESQQNFDQKHYHGTVSMFDKAGFRDCATNDKFQCMVKQLV